MSKAKDVMGKILGFTLLAGIVFGLFTVVAVPFEMYKMAQAQHWPSRKGTITLSYARKISNPREAPWWKTEICGRYLDNGEKFCISRVSYGEFRFGGGKASSEAKVAKYPVGREVEVYYAPEHPKRTILEPHASWKHMIVLLGLGIGFLLVPVLLWLFRRLLEPDRYPRR